MKIIVDYMSYENCKKMKDLIGLQIDSHIDHISVRNDKNEIVEEIILKKE